MRIIKIFCEHFYAFANMEKNTGINGRFAEIINRLYAGNKRAFAQQVGISPTVIENVVGTRQGKPETLRTRPHRRNRGGASGAAPVLHSSVKVNSSSTVT